MENKRYGNIDTRYYNGYVRKRGHESRDLPVNQDAINVNGSDNVARDSHEKEPVAFGEAEGDRDRIELAPGD